METQTAYDQGKQAFTDGKDLEANPFEPQTDDFFDWEGGWVAAADIE